MGSFRKGSLQKEFLQISAKFPQTFRRISAPFPDAIKRIFQISAKFPQNFSKLSAKKPFANDAISEVLSNSMQICSESFFLAVMFVEGQVIWTGVNDIWWRPCDSGCVPYWLSMFLMIPWELQGISLNQPNEFSVNLFLAINSSLTDHSSGKTCD